MSRTNTASLIPPELPEHLSEEQMAEFLADPNVRESRRQARLALLAPPVGERALRGYQPEWLFDGEDVPEPPNVDPSVIDILAEKVGRQTKPLTTKITERFDIYPYAKSVESYGKRLIRKHLQLVYATVNDPNLLEIYEQGSVRSLEYARDNLQINLWLKRRIAEERASYLKIAYQHVRAASLDGKNEPIDSTVLRYAGGAIAEIGLCLRNAPDLLMNFGQDIKLAHSIEHIGLYTQAGHQEALVDNPWLLDFAINEQLKRINYWGVRFDKTFEVFGNRMPDEELLATIELDDLIKELERRATGG